jgi:hypothetical protein
MTHLHVSSQRNWHWSSSMKSWYCCRCKNDVDLNEIQIWRELKHQCSLHYSSHRLFSFHWSEIFSLRHWIYSMLYFSFFHSLCESENRASWKIVLSSTFWSDVVLENVTTITSLLRRQSPLQLSSLTNSALKWATAEYLFVWIDGDMKNTFIEQSNQHSMWILKCDPRKTRAIAKENESNKRDTFEGAGQMVNHWFQSNHWISWLRSRTLLRIHPPINYKNSTKSRILFPEALWLLFFSRILTIKTWFYLPHVHLKKTNWIQKQSWRKEMPMMNHSSGL